MRTFKVIIASKSQKISDVLDITGARRLLLETPATNTGPALYGEYGKEFHGLNPAGDRIELVEESTRNLAVRGTAGDVLIVSAF